MDSLDVQGACGKFQCIDPLGVVLVCGHLGWALDLCRYFRQEGSCNVIPVAKPSFGVWWLGHVGGPGLAGLVWFRRTSMLEPEVFR